MVFNGLAYLASNQKVRVRFPFPAPFFMSSYLSICDFCCDRMGIFKEVFKTGGCTCDICGWSCHCALNERNNFVNSVRVDLIPDNGWDLVDFLSKRFDL